MKRLAALKDEKEHLVRQVEMEEEMITNKLSKKLEKAKQEKVNLENLLEQEQEYIVNKLQKQLTTLLEEKRALETQLRDSTGTILQTLQTHLERWRVGDAAGTTGGATGAASPAQPPSSTAGAARAPGPPSSPEPLQLAARSPLLVPTAAAECDEVNRAHLLVQHLAQEIDALGEQQERYRTECESHRERNDGLRQELTRLEADNAGLQMRIAREREIREEAQAEKALLETELELTSERMFNNSTSSRHSSVASSPALTASRAPLSPRSALMPASLFGDAVPQASFPPLISLSTGMPTSPIRAPVHAMHASPSRSPSCPSDD